MPESANVPGVGKVDRKWILAGGAAVAGIVLFAYWRNSRVPDEEAPEEGAEYATGDQWTPDAYIGATAPGGESYDPNDGTTNRPGTNDEWSQRVVEALVSMAGYTNEMASQTVGKYLAGNPLTLSERILIQTAIALVGNPPSGAIPIFDIPTPTTPNPTPTPGSTKLAKPTLKMSVGNPRNTYYQLDSSKVPGAAYYVFKREAGPGSPTSAAQVGTSRRVGPLKRRYTYQYRVRAISVTPGKTSSDWSNPVRWKVPAK